MNKNYDDNVEDLCKLVYLNSRGLILYYFKNSVLTYLCSNVDLFITYLCSCTYVCYINFLFFFYRKIKMSFKISENGSFAQS